jgi:hypothetical protein
LFCPWSPFPAQIPKDSIGLGGDFSFKKMNTTGTAGNDEEETSRDVRISPHLGYFIAHNLEIGILVAHESFFRELHFVSPEFSGYMSLKENGYSLNPFIKWNTMSNDHFGLTLAAGDDIGAGTMTGDDPESADPRKTKTNTRGRFLHPGDPVPCAQEHRAERRVRICGLRLDNREVGSG